MHHHHHHHHHSFCHCHWKIGRKLIPWCCVSSTCVLFIQIQKVSPVVDPHTTNMMLQLATLCCDEAFLIGCWRISGSVFASKQAREFFFSIVVPARWGLGRRVFIFPPLLRLRFSVKSFLQHAAVSCLSAEHCCCVCITPYSITIIIITCYLLLL